MTKYYNSSLFDGTRGSEGILENLEYDCGLFTITETGVMSLESLRDLINDSDYLKVVGLPEFQPQNHKNDVMFVNVLLEDTSFYMEHYYLELQVALAYLTTDDKPRFTIYHMDCDFVHSNTLKELLDKFDR